MALLTEHVITNT